MRLKIVSLADMAANTNWPTVEDVASGVSALAAIARMQRPVTLDPREAQLLAISVGAVGLAVGRTKCIQDLFKANGGVLSTTN